MVARTLFAVRIFQREQFGEIKLSQISTLQPNLAELLSEKIGKRSGGKLFGKFIAWKFSKY